MKSTKAVAQISLLSASTRTASLLVASAIVLGACSAPTGGTGAEGDPSVDVLPTYGATGGEQSDLTPVTRRTRLLGLDGAAEGGEGGTGTGTQSVNGAGYRGVNLSGAEFGTAIPGKEGMDYRWPTSAEVDYYLAKGMTTFRVGFLWERLQASANAPFTADYFAKLDALVRYATSRNATVIIEPHNFARYYGNTVGSAQVPNAVFADLWARLGAAYKANPSVWFNLVNEPHDLPSAQWVGAANAAIAGARGAGATNKVVVPGVAWTGAHSWYDTSYGTPNAVALLDITDPVNNVVFEAHQYLDSDSSGSSGVCVSATIGSERLAPFLKWLRANGKKGILGEFAGGDNATCNLAIADMLATMKAQSDVLLGWTWWGGGPAWGAYTFALDPTSTGDSPQMALLTPFL
jgi:endoglucanase